MEEKKQLKIGLSCIVKNESKVILKMLESVVNIIDYWCIVDTGSTDGTQDIIKNYFKEKNIDGVLKEIEWKNFSTSRNIALQGLIGYTDWGFWIDADETISFKNKDFSKEILKNKLTGIDSAYVQVLHGNSIYKRMQFFNLSSNWYWTGPVHEILISKKDTNKSILIDDFFVNYTYNGNSWTSQTTEQKYEKYIKLLKDYIDENPNQDNSRWVFYLAQSYKDTGSEKYYEDVIKWYSERLKLEGFLEEKYISQLNIAKFKALSKKYSDEDIIQSFLKCTNFNPDRIEHFDYIIEYYHNKKEWNLAYLFSSFAIKSNSIINKNIINNFLFADTIIYNWKIYDLHCISCYYLNKKDEMKKYAKILEEKINNKEISNFHIERIKSNLKFYLK
jgi:hypothetical protein